MWVLFSLISAIAWATSDALVKKAYSKCDKLDEFFIVWIRYLFALPFVILPLLKVEIPHLDRAFFLWHFVWIPLETTALILYIRAISVSEISISLPFLSLTPLFLIFTGYIILGEKASPVAIMGIILIVSGSYIMGLPGFKGKILEPFRYILKDKGVRLVILVAFLYSITSISGKELVLHSSPVFFSFYYTLVMNIVLMAPGLRGMRRSQWRPCRRWLIGAGMSYAVMTLTHMTAIEMTQVSYMIAMKRLSGVISVFYGWLLFREKEIAPRLAGSLLMVLGAILITIGS